jgi:hypothetical protein
MMERDGLEKCKILALSPEGFFFRKEASGWKKPSKKEVLVVTASGKVTDHKGAMTEINTNRWGVCDNTSHIEVKASSADKTSLKQKKNVERNNKQREERKSKK